MKFTLTKKLALGLLAAFMALGQAPAAEHPGAVTKVVEIDSLKLGSPYKRIWQPFIAKWTKNHLVASYGLELRGKTDMGDVVCSISRNGGKSWGPPITIFDHRIPNGTMRFAYNNSALIKPPRQDIRWCFAMRAPTHFRDSEDAKLCAAYSGDGGLSWTQVELAMDYHGPLITCGGILPVTDETGTRYLLGVHRNTLRHDSGGDRQQFILESRSLLRWKMAGYVPVVPDKPAWIHEGNIAPGDAPTPTRNWSRWRDPWTPSGVGSCGSREVKQRCCGDDTYRTCACFKHRLFLSVFGHEHPKQMEFMKSRVGLDLGDFIISQRR